MVTRKRIGSHGYWKYRRIYEKMLALFYYLKNVDMSSTHYTVEMPET